MSFNVDFKIFMDPIQHSSCNSKSVILEDKFNLTAEYCSHIEEHVNDSIYTEVEREVNLDNLNIKGTDFFSCIYFPYRFKVLSKSLH